MSSEFDKYKKLNELAERDGIVVFGGSDDLGLSIGELRQAFSVEEKMYNRSFSGLSVNNAVSIYDECVAPIAPETVLIHLGEADLESFDDANSNFEGKYRELIEHIRDRNKKCRIALISLKNYEKDEKKEEMNRRLKYIAEAENCEYGDISSKRVWNPTIAKETASFVYSMGFVRPLKRKRPLYDLVKLLYLCEA